MSEWQPIETAPKDGKWVLLCGGSLEDQRHWDTGFDKRPVVAKWDADSWFVCDFDDGYGLGLHYSEPTHWMLIPTHPSQEHQT